VTASNPIADQVAIDIADYISKFANKSFGLRILASESELNEKTLKRLLAKKNNPTYQTLFRLYMVFLDTRNEETVILKAPTLISDELKKFNPKDLRKKVKKEYDFAEMIYREPVLGELFVLAGTGSLHGNTIAFKYGQYGMDLLKKLEDLDIVKEVDKNTYGLTPDGPTLDGKVLKNLGLRFIERFSKPDNTHLAGESMLSFYAESLNQEGITEWLRLDEENFYKKIQVAKKSKYKGSFPAFTFNATDKISVETNRD
jgi:hypothetical protein